MENACSENPLKARTPEARTRIALRVGSCLSDDFLAAQDRRAAELLARVLVDDALERVRFSLAVGLRTAKHLPRDLALKLAHDVDSISCPFLQFTEVFSDSDWEQLLVTISQTARMAVARRVNISDSLAKVLTVFGDSAVAEVLVENLAAPMTRAVCGTLMTRFASNVSLLDKLAARDDLITEIAVRLTSMVSAALREKLVRKYGIQDLAKPLADQAEIGALIQIIAKTPEKDLTAVAKSLQNDNKLTPSLLLRTMEEGHLAFLEAAFSVRAMRSLEHVRSVIRRAGPPAIEKLLERARIPNDMQKLFQDGFVVARNR